MGEHVSDKLSLVALLDIFFRNYKHDDQLGDFVVKQSVGLIKWLSISDYIEGKIQSFGIKDQDNISVELFHRGLKMNLVDENEKL
jgi:hypothetical protein